MRKQEVVYNAVRAKVMLGHAFLAKDIVKDTGLKPGTVGTTLAVLAQAGLLGRRRKYEDGKDSTMLYFQKSGTDLPPYENFLARFQEIRTEMYPRHGTRKHRKRRTADQRAIDDDIEVMEHLLSAMARAEAVIRRMVRISKAMREASRG